MNVFSMSGIILGGLALMMSALLLVQTPDAMQQVASLDFPLEAFRHQPLPPPVPFAIGAAAFSALSWKSRTGRYITLANLLVLSAVIALFA